MSLKIAVQKSGRLSEKSIELLNQAGIKVSTASRNLVAKAENFEAELLFLRDDDIPQYVCDGVADIGIVGANEVAEKQRPVDTVEQLGFSKCRISLAISKGEEYTGLSWFNNKRIATSYPVILQNFLDDNHIKAEIHVISGSVEIAPGIGLADAIFDIVSSGSTLISNGLVEVERVFFSEAVVIANQSLNTEKQALLNEILFRIKAVRKAEDNKYILLNIPNDKIEDVKKIIPGMKSPTVVPLVEAGWSSLHSVVNENDFWEVIGKLKELGAQGILVVPIQKMIL